MKWNAFVSALVCAIAASHSVAADAPERAIKLVVPCALSSSSDVIERLLVESMQSALGQPVIVDNRRGASGAVGTLAVASAPADGDALLIPNSALNISALLKPGIANDLIKSFEPVLLVATWSALLIVNHSVPARNVIEYIDFTQAVLHPFEYATSGEPGSFSHPVTEQFSRAAGIWRLHVPCKGGGPATSALVTGESKAAVSMLTAALTGFISDGRLAMSGVTIAQAFKSAPDVARVAAAARTGRLDPDIRSRIWRLGMQPSPTIPAELGELLREESRTMAAVVKEADIKGD